VTRLFAALAALLLLGASPANRTIPRPGGGPALIIPAGSPVKFRGFDENGVAHFDGRFLLIGSFTYGCNIDCEELPIPRDNLEFNLVPDQQLMKRLPHWQDRGGDMVIYLTRTSRLERALVGQKQLAALLSGKTKDVRGRIAIMVDGYTADFGCDYSPSYSARFVSLPKPPTIAQIEVNGDFGCA
jgi:hypothetical protein